MPCYGKARVNDRGVKYVCSKCNVYSAKIYKEDAHTTLCSTFRTQYAA